MNLKCPCCDEPIELPADPPPEVGERGICPVCMDEYEIATTDPVQLSCLAGDD